ARELPPGQVEDRLDLDLDLPSLRDAAQLSQREPQRAPQTYEGRSGAGVAEPRTRPPLETGPEQIAGGYVDAVEAGDESGLQVSPAARALRFLPAGSRGPAPFHPGPGPSGRRPGALARDC